MRRRSHRRRLTLFQWKGCSTIFQFWYKCASNLKFWQWIFIRYYHSSDIWGFPQLLLEPLCLMGRAQRQLITSCFLTLKHGKPVSVFGGRLRMGGDRAVGAVAALAAPFTIVLFCHVVPRFPLVSLNFIFLISVSSSWYRGLPNMWPACSQHKARLSLIAIVRFGTYIPSKTKARTTLMTGIVSIYSLRFPCRDSVHNSLQWIEYA